MAGNIKWQTGRIGSALALVALVTACTEDGGLVFPGGEAVSEEVITPAQSVELVEHDVEAPDVFQLTSEGLWDGRPSLGGVWVAHPDVIDPERVIIRNQSNGKFVIGALFRREREAPGPALQVSSDAAAALGMLAGAPATLNVTALRREQAAPTAPAATAEFDQPTQIAASTLDPIENAAAAIDAAEAAPAAPAPSDAGAIAKPYIQLGIFSIEENATRTADQLRANGIVPTVLEQSSQGRTFWRVLVGPAATETERTDLMARVKAQGFADAYFVTD